MPVDGTEKCPNCEAEMRFDALYCPNCGNARVSVITTAHPGAIFLMVVAGIVIAIPAWYALVLVGAIVFARVGAPPPSPQEEFVVSWGLIGYCIFLTLLTIAALIFQARQRLNTLTRVFALTFLIVMLGMLSLCDFLAFATRTSS